MASVDNRGRSTPLRHTKVHCQTIMPSEKNIILDVTMATWQDDSAIQNVFIFYHKGFDARKAGLIKIGFIVKLVHKNNIVDTYKGGTQLKLDEGCMILLVFAEGCDIISFFFVDLYNGTNYDFEG